LRYMAHRIAILDPETLKKILIMGAFSKEEAKRMGITQDILETLHRYGLLKQLGKIYVTNREAIEKLIEEYGKLRTIIEGTKRVPTLEISEKKAAKLGEIGIKNIHIIYFHPQHGPMLLCSMRYTKFARLLMENPEIPVTLSTISRRAEEVKIGDTRLVIRTFTTKYHGRELTHILAAEVTTEFDMERTKRILEKMCQNIARRDIALDLIGEIIRKSI